MSNFSSVTTNSARYQEISLNPQKLAGQCGKLKCCLKYEVDAYIDAQKDFPSSKVPLETEAGPYSFFKSDIFSRTMFYLGSGPNNVTGPVGVPVDRVKQIIAMNKKGRKPEKLLSEEAAANSAQKKNEFEDLASQESLTRFDQPKRNNRRKKRSPSRASDEQGAQNSRNRSRRGNSPKAQTGEQAPHSDSPRPKSRNRKPRTAPKNNTTRRGTEGNRTQNDN